MDLRTDGLRLSPSDLDAERGLVGCVIVDSHCFDPASGLPQPPFSLLTLRKLDESAFEQPLADPRRAGHGRAWADRSSRTTARSNWTRRSVQLDRTDTPNLGDWKIQRQEGCAVFNRRQRSAGTPCLQRVTVHRAARPDAWHTGCDVVRNACFRVLMPRGGAIAAP